MKTYKETKTEMEKTIQKMVDVSTNASWNIELKKIKDSIQYVRPSLLGVKETVVRKYLNNYINKSDTEYIEVVKIWNNFVRYN